MERMTPPPDGRSAGSRISAWFRSVSPEGRLPHDADGRWAPRLGADAGRLRSGAVTAAASLVRTAVSGDVRMPQDRWSGARGRRTLIASAAVAIGLWGAIQSYRGVWPDALLTGALAVLTGASVLLAHRRPLGAWRLVVVLLAVLPALPFEPDVVVNLQYTWMWGPYWLDAAAALVLYAVAECRGPAELVWVWLITFGATGLHGIHGLGAVLVAASIAGILLAGYTSQLRRRAGEQELRQAEARATAVALEERSRIARELHDVVAHHMSVLALRADSAPYRLPELSAEARTEFAEIHATAREGLTEMRRLLGVLRDDERFPADAPQPGLEEVGRLVARLRDAGTAVSLSLPSAVGELPAGLALSAYRIVQEALSNAALHAPGGAVRVEVGVRGGALRIEVRNEPGAPGPRTDSDRKRRGLVGMRERVSMLGGSLETGRTPDGGFTVSATLPLDDAVGGTR